MESLKDKLRNSKRIGINPEYLRVSNEARVQVCLLTWAEEPNVSIGLLRSVVSHGIGGDIITHDSNDLDNKGENREWDIQADILVSVHDAVKRKIEDRIRKGEMGREKSKG